MSESDRSRPCEAVRDFFGQFSRTERLLLSNLYLCVLVRGLDPEGEPCYAYFGVFVDSLAQVLTALESNAPFNPKDYNMIVLARGSGEPTKEVQEFMERKFSFSDSIPVLEVSRG